MISISHSSVFVLDQDEALEFYVGKLGFEVNTDVDMGFMRWLTVSAPGDPDREILLEVPGPPAMDDQTAATVRELVTKGATGLAIGIRTDDCRKTYEELKAKGVEFTEGPTEHFYGIDCGLRDPFGNHMRLVQPAEGPLKVPDPSEFARG
jgi:catechol 2,3-dioxygenase-like lactoylglutathione lyase family enzyme